MNSKWPWILVGLLTALVLISVGNYSARSPNTVTVVSKPPQEQTETFKVEKVEKIEVKVVEKIKPISFLKYEGDKCADALRWSQSGLEKMFTKEYLQRSKELNDEIKRRGNSREGHMGKYVYAQMVFWVLANQSNVRTICETGFNMGHSTLVWLHANPTAHVYSFDIGINTVRKHYADYIKERYPDRFTITWGDSTETLPKFKQDNPNVVCDLISVDGGHTYDVAIADLKNFRPMANKEKNTVVIDNLEQDRVQKAWQEALDQLIADQIIRCCYSKTAKTIQNYLAVGEYSHWD